MFFLTDFVNDSVHSRNQGNIDPVYYVLPVRFSPENYATFAQS